MKNTSKFSAFAAMIGAGGRLPLFFSRPATKRERSWKRTGKKARRQCINCIGLSAWVGAGMGVDYEGCAITVSNRSGEGTLFIKNSEGEKYCTDWERLSSYPSAESFDKRALHGETP